MRAVAPRVGERAAITAAWLDRSPLGNECERSLRVSEKGLRAGGSQRLRLTYPLVAPALPASGKGGYLPDLWRTNNIRR